MPVTALDPATAASSQAATSTAVAQPVPLKIRLKRLQHLGIVLLVSLAGPIAGSIYVLMGGPSSTAPIQKSYRLVGALMSEMTSLLLLWYVLGRQGKTWKDIGWGFALADAPRAFGLFIVALIVPVFALAPLQYIYWAYSRHAIAPKSLESMFGFGISVLSIAFVCLNPFFEELIVRAYTMSEIMSVGGSAGIAIVASVAVQISYHLYQGIDHVIALTAVFTIFSIYYAQTRRIVPLILAHLFMDVIFLIRGGF
jgi:membrane protease YdiL (CAAX protease family)